MRLGIDVSTYFEEKKAGVTYYDGDTVCEPLSMFNANGVDIMRIRLWVDPYKGDKPYLGGTCDMENFLKLAKLGMEKGYEIMLDFHYSDFWVDPGKQTIPKAWQNLDKEQLINKVYEYTVESLNTIKDNGIKLAFIQVGNEITNGMLWPVGRLIENGADKPRGNYETLIKIIKAGVKGCREVMPNAQLILHLERSYDTQVYNEFFTQMQGACVDFDIIGFSYYPYWHGTMAQFFNNVDMCKKFGKKLMIVETGYAFTVEDYIHEPDGNAHLVVANTNIANFSFKEEFPLTIEGQCQFTKTLLEKSKQHGIDAVCWWEPIWIPGENICWASVEGQEYINETGKSTRNEWANQCLFDYDGKKTPAFDLFKVK